MNYNSIRFSFTRILSANIDESVCNARFCESRKFSRNDNNDNVHNTRILEAREMQFFKTPSRSFAQQMECRAQFVCSLLYSDNRESSPTNTPTNIYAMNPKRIEQNTPHRNHTTSNVAASTSDLDTWLIIDRTLPPPFLPPPHFGGRF